VALLYVGAFVAVVGNDVGAKVGKEVKGIELGQYSIGVGLPVVALLYVGSTVGFVVGLDTPFTVGVTVGL
jgi:hypothetical protein